MNIAIEEVSSCRRRLSIELPSESVDKELDRISSEFQKVAAIKGYRPGKAPRSIVEKRYVQEIEEELKRTIVPKSFREAIREKKLDVIHVPSVDEIQFERGKPLSFSAVVDLAPNFPMPDYKSIKVSKKAAEISDEDVSKVIDRIREQQADYQEISDRPVQDDDFAIITYTATVDGKPLEELVPDNGSLAKNENFWLWIRDDIFLPGFGKQLVGAAIGDTREVTITFPEDFPQEALRGKQAVYSTKIEGLRERKLPEFNEEFAQKTGGCSVEEITKRIREGMTQEKEREAHGEQLKEIFDRLRSQVDFELPESSVQEEVQEIIYQIIRENQMRGIPDNILEEKRQEIIEAAQKSAQDRVKLHFILARIAREENITISREEFSKEIESLAQRSNTTAKKLAKQLNDNNGFGRLEEDMINRKTVDFLLKSATQE